MARGERPSPDEMSVVGHITVTANIGEMELNAECDIFDFLEVEGDDLNEMHFRTRNEPRRLLVGALKNLAQEVKRQS